MDLCRIQDTALENEKIEPRAPTLKQYQLIITTFYPAYVVLAGQYLQNKQSNCILISRVL